MYHNKHANRSSHYNNSNNHNVKRRHDCKKKHNYRKNHNYNRKHYGKNNHWYRHSSSQYLYDCLHQRQLPVVILVLGIIIELIILFAAVHITTSAMNESDDSKNSKESVTEHETQKVTTGTESEFAEQCREIYEANKDLLVLVNKDNAIPDDYYITLRMTNGGKVKVAAILYNDLVEMLSDASDASEYSYALLSGYRTSEYQQQLVDTDVQKYISDYGMSYEKALEKTYEQVMPAGYSEHETGLALDITSAENTTLDESQADEPAIQWLDENCWKYGFILRYPQDKEDVTGITYEPWHFRYVGREAAKFMHENDLTLEEFYEYL